MSEHTPKPSWALLLARRAVRASLLDAHVYEEVEADRGSIAQAATVVACSAAAAGLGSFENGGWAGVVWCTLAAFAGWAIWAWLACIIGTRLLPQPHTSSNVGELLRTLGFASAPGLLRVLGAVPGLEFLNPWLYVVTGVWMLVAMVVAIRQALDYDSTGRALAVAFIGSPVEAALLVSTMLFVGPWPV